MREYIVGENKQSEFIRALVGGRINSGKTHFASTAPKPLFISDAQEGGAATLRHMDTVMWWDPKVKPEVWEIEGLIEIPKVATRLLELKGPLKWQTIVVDSISILGQRVLRELKINNPGQDNRQRYGDLGDTLSIFVPRMHTLKAHIVWLCHVDEEMQLTVPGRSTQALWAYMSHKWLLHVETAPGREPDFQLHHRPYLRANWLGGRSKINAPSPMIPSFKPLWELLGFPEKPVSPTCPNFGGQAYPLGATYLPQS